MEQCLIEQAHVISGKANPKFYLGSHYNGGNSYLLANGKEQ